MAPVSTPVSSTPPFDLVPLATVRVTRGDIHRLGETAFHRRVIGGISHGRWEGERFAGDGQRRLGADR